MHDILVNEYFTWLREIIGVGKYSKRPSYLKLLTRLHEIDFGFVLEMDENRAEDGIDLRYRFCYEKGYDSEVVGSLLRNKPCSVLEMMVALSMRCEERIMDDTDIGNRTGKWFWTMINNLGLAAMDDSNFDSEVVDYIVERFMHREYEPNGKGGLFIFDHCKRDLRKVEIWYQMMWYLNDVLKGYR